jgi:hypothetical protein
MPGKTYQAKKIQPRFGICLSKAGITYYKTKKPFLTSIKKGLIFS